MTSMICYQLHAPGTRSREGAFNESARARRLTRRCTRIYSHKTLDLNIPTPPTIIDSARDSQPNAVGLATMLKVPIQDTIHTPNKQVQFLENKVSSTGILHYNLHDFSPAFLPIQAEQARMAER